MPFINSKVSLKLSEESKEIIKTELGKLISEIPGKSEQWLMVGFDDACSMYFKGKKEDRTAFIEVKIYGKAERKYKEVLTQKICQLYEKELSIPKHNIYIVFQQIEDWGWNGSMF